MTEPALFESLRAVYEPYNHSRKVVGFDTFAGYPPSVEDGRAEIAKAGGTTSRTATSISSRLLDYH